MDKYRCVQLRSTKDKSRKVFTQPQNRRIHWGWNQDKAEPPNSGERL